MSKVMPAKTSSKVTKNMDPVILTGRYRDKIVFTANSVSKEHTEVLIPAIGNHPPTYTVVRNKRLKRYDPNNRSHRYLMRNVKPNVL